MPLDKAALVGCAVMTGVGAVINTARIEPGASVLVIGCGGVGLNVVQGAVLAGAERIIAVDTLQNKLAYAREFGATDTLVASEGDVPERVIEMTSGGVDYAFEAIGNPHCIRQCYEALALGGTAVVVGMAAESAEVNFNALSMPRGERAIVGSWYGSARPWVDFPKLVNHYMSGRLQIDSMITRTWRLEEINEAYEDARPRRGRAQRHPLRLSILIPLAVVRLAHAGATVITPRRSVETADRPRKTRRCSTSSATSETRRVDSSK